MFSEKHAVGFVGSGVKIKALLRIYTRIGQLPSADDTALVEQSSLRFKLHGPERLVEPTTTTTPNHTNNNTTATVRRFMRPKSLESLLPLAAGGGDDDNKLDVSPRANGLDRRAAQWKTSEPNAKLGQKRHSVASKVRLSYGPPSV